MIYYMQNKKWCQEKETHIDPTECVNETEDCECFCHPTRLMLRRLDNRTVATITYDRSLPEEDEPTTYISVVAEELEKLPELIREALQKNPNDNFYVTVTTHI